MSDGDKYPTWPSFQITTIRYQRKPEGPHTPHQWEERPSESHGWTVADCKVCDYGIQYPDDLRGDPFKAAEAIGADLDCDAEVVKSVLKT